MEVSRGRLVVVVVIGAVALLSAACSDDGTASHGERDGYELTRLEAQHGGAVCLRFTRLGTPADDVICSEGAAPLSIEGSHPLENAGRAVWIYGVAQTPIESVVAQLLDGTRITGSVRDELFAVRIPEPNAVMELVGQQDSRTIVRCFRSSTDPIIVEPLEQALVCPPSPIR
jgi:hypothetical protein